MDYTAQLDTIITALAGVQTRLAAVESIFSGGFFWFALFCVGFVLILIGALLFLLLDFFKRLLWR